MVYKNPNGRYYIAKFMWHGKMIRKSTRASDKKTARAVEARLRVELAKGNWDILEARPQSTLREFLQKEFLPFVGTKSKTKPKTVDYYEYGVRQLLKLDFANLRLNEITDQQSAQFAAKNCELSASTINNGLRTLRRALNLASQWGKLDRMPKITLAKGEKQRERIVTDDEFAAYINHCRQPWHDVATCIFHVGLCPGELYRMRWEHLLFLDGEDGASGKPLGLIQIAEGKTKARRRLLPMMPQIEEVYLVLKARWEAAGRLSEGWVFPSNSASGHFDENSAKNQHARALKLSSVKPFEPYCLRHTALTRLGEHCDAFTLSKIAGHSSITITQRYCHPQADAIERAFSKLMSGKKLVTEGGHRAKLLPTAANTDEPPNTCVAGS
jgi:integrase